MTTLDERRDAWDKAKKVKGKDPSKYRKDKFGNCMYWGSYGKNSAMGWQIDHWVPRTKRGGDTPNNRNSMNTRANLKKGNLNPKTKTFMRMWKSGEFYFDKHPKCRPVFPR